MSDKTTGAERISRERQRQIEVEGWTAEHDNAHPNGELAKAAACYANPSLKEGDSDIPFE